MPKVIDPVDGAAAPLEDDVLCPLCEYNLRGLTESRCPECGAAFNFDELRDPARRKHPYLFEHHPERNIRSLFRTLRGGLRPGKFWRTFQPVQPSRPGRLVLYWVCCVVLSTVAYLCQYTRDACALYRQVSMNRALQVQYFKPGGGVWAGRRVAAGQGALNSIKAKYGSFQAYLELMYPLPPSLRFFKGAAGIEGQMLNVRYRPFTAIEYATMGSIAVLIVWPIATAITMLLFRASMKRGAIRPIHLLRVTIYSADIIVWVSASWLIVLAMDLLSGHKWSPIRSGIPDSVQEGMVGWCAVAVVILLNWRLGAGIGHYLRFRHALAMGISVQIILFLIALHIWTWFAYP